MDTRCVNEIADGTFDNKKQIGHIHVIREGDTLYEIARLYDIRIFDIMRLNPYLNVYNLQIGDEILIPSVEASDEA